MRSSAPGALVRLQVTLVAVMGCGPIPEPSDESLASTGAVTGSSTLAAESSVDDSGMGPKLDVPIVDLGSFPPPGDCIDDWGACVEPTAASDLMASTPVGDFELTLAVFGASFFCECWPEWPVSVVIMPTDPTTWDENIQDGLFIDIGNPAAGLLQDVRLRARRGTDFASTDAMLTLDAVPTFDELLEPEDPEVPAVVTGSLSVDAEGWSVSGMFVASYCSAMSHGSGSCE